MNPKDFLKDLATLRRARQGQPKHAQLSDCFKRAIADGVLKPGDKLPTETELVTLAPYSLGTIQRAIRSLVEAGLVQRKPKMGTFVTEARRTIDEPWHFRFLRGQRGDLLPVYPTVVSRRQVSQRGPWSKYIKGRVVRIDRVVNVNDEFCAYSRFFFNGQRYPLFEKVALDSLHGENFRRFLHKQIPERIERISHRVALYPPPAKICRLIGIQKGVACTLFQITVVGTTGNALYYQELTVPPSSRLLELADPALLASRT